VPSEEQRTRATRVRDRHIPFSFALTGACSFQSREAKLPLGTFGALKRLKSYGKSASTHCVSSDRHLTLRFLSRTNQPMGPWRCYSNPTCEIPRHRVPRSLGVAFPGSHPSPTADMLSARIESWWFIYAPWRYHHLRCCLNVITSWVDDAKSLRLLACWWLPLVAHKLHA
jgi:hypothetical protein